MLSNFASIVNSTIETKKAEINKDDKMYKYENWLKDMERKLDNGDKNASQAISELRDRFRGEMYLKSWEYSKIKTELERNLK